MPDKDQNMLIDNARPDNPTGFDEPEPDREPETIAAQEETVVEEVAGDLNVDLPKVNLPLPMKIVALITLVAGLGSLASLFTGIFSPNEVALKTYFLNIVAGALFIVVSYGLTKRQNWSTWLLGLLVFIGLFINWPLAILPAAIVIYLVFNRKYLYPSIFDKLFSKLLKGLGKQMK